LLAGGVEFFEAVLAIRCPDDREAPACTTTFPATASRLFVCGSAAAWHKARQRQCAAHGIPVLTMPAELATSQPSVAARKRWIESAVQAIAPTGAAMMAIGSQDAEVSPPVLARRLAEAVQGALESIRVDWLLVEGGATAAALVRQMRWTRFRVRSPHSPGVVALDIDGTRQPALILKPGSYEWPDYVWPR
ncbi:MAG: nucleotide-binding domain containing protein, partial [Gemmataceae bacterium]